jgi:hypothetical protein
MNWHAIVLEFGHLLPWAGAWLGVGFIGGVLVGWQRNRWLPGPILGTLLGPLGWLLVARVRSRLRECPSCSRIIASGASTCRHCGADVRKTDARSTRATFETADRGGRW